MGLLSGIFSQGDHSKLDGGATDRITLVLFGYDAQPGVFVASEQNTIVRCIVR